VTRCVTPDGVKLALGIALAMLLSSCGNSKEPAVGLAGSPAPRQDDEWPAHVTAPPDAVPIKAVLGASDGAQVRVRAYLVATTLPCPVCNTSLGEQHTPKRQQEDVVGRARQQPSTPGPGCAPCPTPAATFSDEAPKGSGGAAAESAPLRAVGSAEGLQKRHIGKIFLLSGTFHANGAFGPELDVTDVRVLDGP
jgi:hypothetical protein